MITPTSMLPRPAMRNSRSVTSSSLANARFTPRGCRNGAIPSKTKNSARAASRSVKFKDTRCSRRSSALTGAGILQVLEELAVRRHDEQVAVLAERALIRLQASVERIELGIFRVGLCIGLGRLRIAVAADPQSIALRVREYLGSRTLRSSTNPDTGTLSFRPQLARDLHEI